MSPKNAAVLVLAGTLLLAGCGIDPRVRLERPAGQSSPSPAPALTAMGTPSDLDGMRVLREDPRLGTKVTSAIKRCSDGRYPIYSDEISLSGDPGSVRLLAVTVYTCPGRTCGYEGTRGTYVYRFAQDRPAGRVFADQAAGSRVEVQNAALVLVRPSYMPGDAADCPTSTSSTPLRWNGRALVLDGA
ncbi:hypothetical protein [Nonomuraea endophytica]|uniref:Lipoprotein n=1 Tax=Nonomuraea endophytica TaxID=714136 RepID=A0A7W8A527_9ACTN|nr:hypothetical protein [Nonomuraea endophytica]MBB5079025.1 hypothetical protein [Nonomuraea endophytica]